MATALARIELPVPLAEALPPAVLARGQDAELPAKLFRKTLSLSLDLADASGGLTSATDLLEQKAQAVSGALVKVDQTAKDIVRISQRLSASSSGADAVRRRVEGAVGSMQTRVEQTRDRTMALGQSAELIGGQLDTAGVQLKALGAASATIQNIAREIQLLAVNAGVEAARHGAAGRGFAVIAEAVKKLADQTRSSTSEIERHQKSLATTILSVQTAGVANRHNVVAVESDSRELALGIAEMTDVMRGVASALGENAEAARVLDEASGRCSDVLRSLKGAAVQVVTISESIDRESERFATMVDIIEAANVDLIDSGALLSISPLVDLCRSSAVFIAAEMRNEIAAGGLSRAALFDTSYQPIPGTNPPQFEAQFTRFTDRALSRFLDEVK
ncbi:MAG: methyl-accepting chemotaxis protein, partial [Beijerinckiaceae bacterium]